MKTYPVIEVPSDGKSRWFGGAYCLYFVYSKYNGNFILKGYSYEVQKYLKTHYTHYFYFNSLWCEKKSRGGWHFWKDDVYIVEPSMARKTFKYRVTMFKERGTDLWFKRLPKRWIPEFDKL